jgi:hypothetical protein
MLARLALSLIVTSSTSAGGVTVWIVPVVEMARAGGAEMWTEIEAANAGDGPLSLDVEVRRPNGALHPSSVRKRELASGERAAFRFERDGDGALEIGWARVVETRPGRRSQLKLRASAYMLRGNELIQFPRNVRPAEVMRGWFFQQWRNQNPGRRLYAINATGGEAWIEVCFGKGGIRRRELRCEEDKRIITVPAGGTRMLHVTRTGPASLIYRASDDKETRLWLAILRAVEGKRSVFDVDSSVQFEEPAP